MLIRAGREEGDEETREEQPRNHGTAGAGPGFPSGIRMTVSLALYETKFLNTWKTLAFPTPEKTTEARLKKPEKLIERPPEARLKACTALTHSASATLPLNHRNRAARQVLPGRHTQFCGALGLLRPPFPVRPHRGQPARLRCPWDSPGKNSGVGCHFLLQCMHIYIYN